MRTTLTLDDDLSKSLKDYAQRTRASFKVALNTVLRRGLAAQDPSRKPSRRFRVEPHAGGFKPGIDVAKLNQLIDEMETGSFVRGHRRKG
ncbi:MAG: antitoxin [Thermoanaerobaculia bacterium]